MSDYLLRIELLSYSAFGRGDGVAGLVDSEVEHDRATGLPYIKGRTIKGLIVESCADILYAIENTSAHQIFHDSGAKLFGVPGSTQDAQGCLYFSDAEMPDDFVAQVEDKLSDDSEKSYTPQAVLEALSTIRRQTAIDPTTDSPLRNSLRATRLLMRGLVFWCKVYSDKALVDEDETLLAACCAGLRRGGQNRTRGAGNILVTAHRIPGGADLNMNIFAQILSGGKQ